MKFVAKTDVGKKRKNNEDSYYAKNLGNDVELYIVADGLGGYEGGEIASKVLVEKISSYIESNKKRLGTLSHEKVMSVIKMGLLIANEEIYKLEKTSEKYKGMGTTVVLVLKVKEDIYYLSVGDSRIYYINNKCDKIEQVTVDDTYVNELIKTNVIKEEEAVNHPQKHVLTKAVGILKNISAEVSLLNIKEGYIMLCSDGVTNMLTEENILHIFKRNKFENLADKIVEQANANGGLDNITTIIIHL